MPQTPSAGRALVAPALTDVADAPDGFADLILQIDRIASISAGTLAARPAANATVGTAIGNPFSFYYASDTGELFLSFASTWIPLNMGPPVPIGSSIEYGGSADPSDSRWLLEDGRALLRAGQYAPLYGVLGTTYGVGDGSTTFNIPDSRGRVTVGPDNMGTATGTANRLDALDGLGNVGGEQKHTLSAGELPDHKHYAESTNNPFFALPYVEGSYTAGDWEQLTSGALGAGSGRYVPTKTSAGGQSGYTWSTGDPSNVNGLSHNVMQPYVVKNKIIRVR